MKKLLALLLIPFTLYAEGPVFDPTKRSEITIDGITPTEYTDNSPMAFSEIFNIQLYRSQSPIGPWGSPVDMILTPATVSYTEDITVLPEGQYYYHAVITDVLGNKSGMSNLVPMEVRMQPDPKPVVLSGWR